jgi:BASS family bile acid:Na+ symporter
VASLETFGPRLLAAIALVAMMLQLGLELEPVEDRATKRRRRWLLLRALAFNFVAVPLLALAVARLLGARGPVAVALLLLAACPGGRHAPALAKAGHGDAALAVEITLWSNKLNPILAPLWAAVMLGTHRVEVHELNFIAQLLALQLVPFVVAKQLKKRKPALAARLARPARTTGTVAALALLAFLIAHHLLRDTLVLGARGWMAVLLFGALLALLGLAVGGRDPATRRTFAFTAESRNVALALVIANLTGGERMAMLALFGAWILLFAFGAALATVAHHVPRPLARAPA